ncbi:MAG: beta-ketoacyl-ACP synthase II [Candidatus Hydrogenedentes bacterium]|nr:beta-ketoacyl-ACP synthase II [Candidatus Hydrogenedentota bacterium]
MSTRAVITGLGVVSPVGNTVDTFWNSLCEGKSGIGPITHFDASEYRTRIAGQADDVTPEGMTAKDLNRMDRYSVFAVEACDQAWKQSGLRIEELDPFRCGAVFGSGIGGIGTIAEEVVRLHEGGPRRVSPFMIPKGIASMAAGNVAIRLGLRGPNKSIVTACASANHCIGEAASLIRLGKADVIVAGGAEAPVIPFGVAGFISMRAMSTRNDAPEQASRPFDKDRDGFVLGEGAGALVIESEEHAKARGAEILAEVGGMGETCDAFHLVAPREDGSGAARAIQFALEDAGIQPEDIDYFNAHGTSTRYNEVAEAKSLRTVFGDNMPLVSSTKSMTGHLLGAASAIEAIACIQSIRSGVIPPSINFETPDPECEVNLVANEAREADVAITLSNALGFGGHNAALVLRRYV